MPNDGTTLIKLKVGSLNSIDNGEISGTVSPAIDPGSVLFGVDTANHKGKILLDLPDGTQRIVMSTDAEYADVAGSLNSAAAIDGVLFDGSSGIIHYGVCSTAGATAAKTVTCNGFLLTNGSRIIIKYTNTNTANNPTLNVNNGQTSLGAKPIYYKGAAMPATYISANELHEYIYDGTNWNYVGASTHDLVIDVTEATHTLHINSPVTNGDGVSY